MSINITKELTHIISENGFAKPMKPFANPDVNMPSFFLMRKFIGLNDLLIIFHSKKCRYDCNYCSLNNYNSNEWISAENIINQFHYVLNEVKHSLHIIDSITFSNNGSILDEDTFPFDAFIEIIKALNRVKSLKKVVIETRFEFVSEDKVDAIINSNKNVKLDFLIGFETLNSEIKKTILGKKYDDNLFNKSLDIIAEKGGMVTMFIIYKSSPYFDDEQAYKEAKVTFDFLKETCQKKNIPLIIRVNPIYLPPESVLGKKALEFEEYMPPNISDVFQFSKYIIESGIPVYIGLSDEGLGCLSYKNRQDFQPKIIREIIIFNESNKL